MLSTNESPVLLHATDTVAEAIEDLQFTLGEGPCVDASASGAPVLVQDLDDLAAEERSRWPMFLPEAKRAGAQALFAFPVRFGAVGLGTVDLYRRTAGPLTSHQLSLGRSVVDQIGTRMLDLDSAGSGEPAVYPMTVHQAAGMVMVQLGTSIETALVRLRAAAYTTGVPVAQLAGEVLAGRRRFTEEER